MTVENRIVDDKVGRQKSRPGDEGNVERLVDIADALNFAVFEPVVLCDLIGMTSCPHVGTMAEAGRPGRSLVKRQTVKAKLELRLQR